MKLYYAFCTEKSCENFPSNYCFSSQEIFSSFFKQITNQLLSLAEAEDFKYIDLDGTMMFVGETFSRICRRGSAGQQDLYVVELIFSIRLLLYIKLKFRKSRSRLESSSTIFFSMIIGTTKFWFSFPVVMFFTNEIGILYM